MKYTRVLAFFLGLFYTQMHASVADTNSTEAETVAVQSEADEPDSDQEQKLRHSIEVSIFKAEEGIKNNVSIVQMLVYTTDLKESLADFENFLKDSRGMVDGNAEQWDVIKRSLFLIERLKAIMISKIESSFITSVVIV